MQRLMQVHITRFVQVNPKGDLVLAKVAEAEEKTTGGVFTTDISAESAHLR